MSAGLLDGRRALVTGAGRGLGLTIAAKLATEGAMGVCADLPGVGEYQPPTGWHATDLDVRDPVSVAAGFDVACRSGPVDLVVACAGVVPPWTQTADIDPGEWDAVFAVNARGVALTVREAARRMTDRGTIVVMASLNGWRGDPNIASYVASKHAAVGITKAAALDLGRRGIRVNAVAPGPVATDALLGRMRSRAASGGPPLEEALQLAEGQTALGRLGTIDDVAAAVLFLSSDLSAGTTGHLLPVDGGLL